MLPEHPIIISPTLAATIGLEEAVLLQTLSELIKHKGVVRAGASSIRWVELSSTELQQAVPFWNAVEITRVRNSLQALGLIKIENTGSSNSHWFAIEDASAAAPSKAKQPRAAHARFAPAARTSNASTGVSDSEEGLLALDWQPDENWIKHCMQHAIPRDFVVSMVPKFISYWRDRGRQGAVGRARFSWGNQFYKHVLQQWRQEQARRGTFENASEMKPQWRPSPDAVELLLMGGVDADFIEKNVPEFVFRCKEQGEVFSSWNTYFINYIRKNWAKHTATAGLDNTPTVISPNWEPNAKCWDMIRLAEIDEDFARERLPQFILYWEDAQEVKSSWNSAFLDHLKYEWKRRQKLAEVNEIEDGNDQFIAKSTREKVEAKLKQLSDKSWLES